MNKTSSIKLSRHSLKNIYLEKVVVPDEKIFELPEKVLQFNTGILLRGLPDYFIDEVNRMGIFNGKIIMVKLTSGVDTTALTSRMDYILCVSGAFTCLNS